MIFSDSLTVTRYSAQTRDAYGRVQSAGVASTFTIAASVQRPSGWRLEKLLDGGHTRDAWHIDTTTALRTANELTGVPADRVTVDGLVYEVFESAQVRAVIPHYETLALRVEEGIQP